MRLFTVLLTASWFFLMAQGFSQAPGSAPMKNQNRTPERMIKDAEKLLPAIEGIPRLVNERMVEGLKLCTEDLKRSVVREETVTGRNAVMFYLFNIVVILLFLFFFFQQRRVNKDIDFWIGKTGELQTKLGKSNINTSLKPKRGFKITFYLIFGIGFFLFNLISLFL